MEAEQTLKTYRQLQAIPRVVFFATEEARELIDLHFHPFLFRLLFPEKKYIPAV